LGRFRPFFIGWKNLNQNERELADRILDGDPSAFQEFYNSHKKAVIRACWYFLGSDAEVEDRAQEAFLQALKNLGRFRFECALSTWLNHIAVNLCLDLLDKKKKELSLSPDFFGSRPIGKRENPYPEETLKVLREEIEGLDDRDRELVTLRDIQGLSCEAVANRLRIPAGSVTSGLSQARQKLMERVRGKLPKGWEERMP
jgi:RNA polymerase sigma-70 factor (ECF subfamily)